MDIEMREKETDKDTHTQKTLISKYIYLSKELVKKDL